MTTLSILIPHYNDPDGFALTLRSIEAQTWKGSREVVVCDDGSTHAARSKLERIINDSPEQIRLLQHAKNLGRPFARNTLLDAAEGKYTTWCDAGDEIYPEKIERQLVALYRARLLKFKPPVWCTCHYDMHWAGRRASGRRQDISADMLGNLLLATLRAYLWTLLGTTQSFRDVGYFDTKLPRLQDLDYFIRFVEKGGMFILPSSDESLVVYHKSDIGKASAEVLRCNRYILEKHAPLLLTRSRRFRRNRYFDMYMLAARFAANNDDTPSTLSYLARAARYNPVVFAKRIIEKRGWPL